jgi:hypothetical protein
MLRRILDMSRAIRQNSSVPNRGGPNPTAATNFRIARPVPRRPKAR